MYVGTRTRGREEEMLKFSKGKKGKTDDEETTNTDDRTSTDKDMSNNKSAVPEGVTKTRREEVLEETLERERKNFKRKMDEVGREMLMYKAENEKLRHAMKHDHGSPELSGKTKKELDHLRSTNKFLLENLEKRKQQIYKLETEVFELDVKLQAVNKSLAETERNNQNIKLDMEELVGDRILVNTLMDENRTLRHFMTMNKLDMRTGKRMLNHVIQQNQEEDGSLTDRSQKTARESVDRVYPGYHGYRRRFNKER